MLFPTDLASFLDFIRQHGDAAYSLMFGYAASHSLLLALFAGYAAHSGALSFGTLIMVRQFRGRRDPLLDRAPVWHPLAPILFQGLNALSRLRPGWRTVTMSG